MEAPEPTFPAPATRDQTVPMPGPTGAPSGQASPRLTLGPIILPPEQGLPPAMILKALPIPLYHTVPPGGLQPRAPLVTGSLEGGTMPFILSPLLQPEGPGSAQVGKPATPALTVNIVGTLPVLSPGLGPALGSPGKVRNAGKYLCPHCGRDCLKPSVLEKHIRSHTGERPFPCATCGIAFKTQSNLYKHRRTQTHLNNSRLSLECEAGGSSVSEEGNRAGEPSAGDSRPENWSQRTSDGAPGRPLSPGAHLSLDVKNLEAKAEVAPPVGSIPAGREGPTDSSQTTLPGLPLATTQSWRKLPEAKPGSLQRQQEMSSEKPWDAKASEGRLRKCESTDSGYLSRSDSVEQPPPPSSPLHSLSEHSAESEGEGGPGSGPGRTGAEPAAPAASVELEKKRLEERIAQLISHNQAVVDDPQLDHVRPRKTVLSKQGSIDLPMPYTYKDSFHFDIRALEPGRRRAALSPACSTFTALDKSRPLFFHSVPTQLSSTVEYVPVTRSNSLPFVEASSTWPEPRDRQDTCPTMQKPLSPRLAPARLGCRSGLTLAGVSSGHPRALVRQAAVEDVFCTPTSDPVAPTESLDGKRIAPGEGVPCTSRGSGKKCGQRKPKMFSQEKWQVYGNDTFRRIYQKMKASHQGVRKARDGPGGHGTELPPPQKEAAESKGAAPSQDSGTPVLGDASVAAKPVSQGSPPAPEGPVDPESPELGRTGSRAEARDQLRMARAVSSPTLGSRVPSGSGSRSPLLSPNGQQELRWQLPLVPGPLHEGDLGAPRPAVSDLQLEGGVSGDGGVKETHPRASAVLRRPGGGSGEPWPAEDKLPSERKKLKVEGLNPQEQLGPLAAEISGASAQDASLPSQRQDSDPREIAGVPQEQAKKVADHLAPSGTFSAALAAAQRQAGLEGKEPTLPPAVGAAGQHSQQVSRSQAPHIFPAMAGSSFPPKYLLRLPQGDTPSPLPVPVVSIQGQHSLCTAGPPKELGMPWPPGLASDPILGEVDGSPEEPSCFRPRDGKSKTPLGREKQAETDACILAPVQSPGSAPGPPRDTASLLPVSTCDTLAVQDKGGEPYDTCHSCTDSTSARTRTSGGVLKTQASGRELQRCPEDVSEDPPLKVSPCCSVQPGSFPMARSRPQPLPLGHLTLSLTPNLGTLGSCGAQSPFPSLRAEPQLTWCCLRRSLPLPQEQKEKAASVYSALHFPGGSLQGGGPDAQPLNGGEHITAGTRTQDLTLDPEWKKGLSRRRTKTVCRNSKQRKLKTNPKSNGVRATGAPPTPARLHPEPWRLAKCAEGPLRQARFLPLRAVSSRAFPPPVVSTARGVSGWFGSLVLPGPLVRSPGPGSVRLTRAQTRVHATAPARTRLGSPGSQEPQEDGGGSGTSATSPVTYTPASGR
ncbi:zinc finger protein 831 [Octodon degus]|uniref:Zinc finger protein 831 n=1 Tax=Octodon degus TaxID=10160 RepID=A0A6P6DTG3_OCTDE|nr:zinc finger protein 831 [Octodon degus]